MKYSLFEILREQRKRPSTFHTNSYPKKKKIFLIDKLNILFMYRLGDYLNIQYLQTKILFIYFFFEKVQIL